MVKGLFVVCVNVSVVINEFVRLLRLEVCMVRVSLSLKGLVSHCATYCYRKALPTTIWFGGEFSGNRSIRKLQPNPSPFVDVKAPIGMYCELSFGHVILKAYSSHNGFKNMQSSPTFKKSVGILNLF